MAIMIKKTGTDYFSISIGFILMIQVIQIQLIGSSAVHDRTEKSRSQELEPMNKFPDEGHNLRSNKMTADEQIKQDDVTKLFDMRSRVNKQLRSDVQTNYDEDGWKTFSLNDKNSISVKKLYPKKFPFYNDAPSQSTYDESRIVFPDEQPSYTPQDLNPPACENSVLCENVPDYPSDLIESRLLNDKYLDSFQSRDEIVEVNNRIGSSDDEPLCLSTEEVKYPKVGLTRDETRMYIVNGENFIQAVRVEICKNENSPCRLINEFASGYRTMCEQKYIYRQLLGIQKDGSLSPEYFKIPSSCCCHVKFIGNTWERMGRGLQNYSSKHS